jgi:hypothetical protein
LQVAVAAHADVLPVIVLDSRNERPERTSATVPLIPPRSEISPTTVIEPTKAEVEDREAAPSDDSVRWPDEANEAAFLAERSSVAGEVLVLPTIPRAGETVRENLADDSKVTLPALQQLVDKIAPETRDVLEDLFRARFVSVKRIPKTALKEF